MAVEYNVYTFERFIIPFKYVTEEMLQNFPDDIRSELKDGEIPCGVGYHHDAGWFCIGSAGQGPFFMYIERGEDEE